MIRFIKPTRFTHGLYRFHRSPYISFAGISGAVQLLHSAATATTISKTPSLPSPSFVKKSNFQMINQLIKSTGKPGKPLVWIDCEMTGLDVFGSDRIIEICCIITDENLNTVNNGEFYESTIYYPEEKLNQMNEWCIKNHGKSGLTQRVLDHPEQTLEKVQLELLSYIQKYITTPRKGILAGNSIHMDKFFMMKDFPKVVDFLHYRLLDVSTIMEFGSRHAPELMSLSPDKKSSHTAKSDILESIAQLKWYRDNYFKSEEQIAETVNNLKREKKNRSSGNLK
ncbi:rex2 [Candida oxycetoniae]|uniref:Rex2 n=1 Tax=Candida oxycetoniae TaxID=497107 RepID=A0AAI9WZZ0_9ASCO|nr:rex2 [Candida oxycetoniae]KAI3406564.2 rex2 [Candida oxycetoniae]